VYPTGKSFCEQVKFSERPEKGAGRKEKEANRNLVLSPFSLLLSPAVSGAASLLSLVLVLFLSIPASTSNDCEMRIEPALWFRLPSCDLGLAPLAYLLVWSASGF
jgi:hypothetical protein